MVTRRCGYACGYAPRLKSDRLDGLRERELGLRERVGGLRRRDRRRDDSLEAEGAWAHDGEQRRRDDAEREGDPPFLRAVGCDGYLFGRREPGAADVARRREAARADAHRARAQRAGLLRSERADRGGEHGEERADQINLSDDLDAGVGGELANERRREEREGGGGGGDAHAQRDDRLRALRLRQVKLRLGRRLQRRRRNLLAARDRDATDVFGGDAGGRAEGGHGRHEHLDQLERRHVRRDECDPNSRREQQDLRRRQLRRVGRRRVQDVHVGLQPLERAAHARVVALALAPTQRDHSARRIRHHVVRHLGGSRARLLERRRHRRALAGRRTARDAVAGEGRPWDGSRRVGRRRRRPAEQQSRGGGAHHRRHSHERGASVMGSWPRRVWNCSACRARPRRPGRRSPQLWLRGALK